jgi:hypothetical protein
MKEKDDDLTNTYDFEDFSHLAKDLTNSFFSSKTSKLVEMNIVKKDRFVESDDIEVTIEDNYSTEKNRKKNILNNHRGKSLSYNIKNKNSNKVYKNNNYNLSKKTSSSKEKNESKLYNEYLKIKKSKKEYNQNVSLENDFSENNKEKSYNNEYSIDSENKNDKLSKNKKMFKNESYDELSFIEEIKKQDSSLNDLNNTDDHLKVQWQEFINCILTILSIVSGVFYYDIRINYKYSKAVNFGLANQKKSDLLLNYIFQEDENINENLIINLLVVESISVILFSKY